jgi:hypothetical protein
MEGLIMAVDFTSDALPYAKQLGWKVLLLGRGWKLPYLRKEMGGRGVTDASSDVDQIREWGRICPNGNIGVACGVASGIVVIDVDPRNGGDASLAALAAKGYIMPCGPRQRTGNRGWHYLFKADHRVGGSRGKLGPGIDVKSAGGYILVAPSWIRKSDDGLGGPYAWEVSPFHAPIPRMPLWMTALLCPPPRPPSTFRSGARSGDIEPLARFVAASPKGERNDRLYWASCRVRELVSGYKISEASSIQRLTMAAAACGLVGPEVLRTIRSGLDAANEAS